MTLKTHISIGAVLAMMTVSSCGGLSFDNDIYAEDVQPTSVEAPVKAQVETESGAEEQANETLTALIPPKPIMSIADAEEAVAVPVEDVVKKPVTAADLLVASNTVEHSKPGDLLKSLEEETVTKVTETADDLPDAVVDDNQSLLSEINAPLDPIKKAKEEITQAATTTPIDVVSSTDLPDVTETIEQNIEDVEKAVAEHEDREDLSKPEGYIPLSEVPERPVLTAQERADEIRQELQRDIEQSRLLRDGASVSGNEDVAVNETTTSETPVDETVTAQADEQTPVNEQETEQSNLVPYISPELVPPPEWEKSMAEEKQNNLLKRLEKEEKIVAQTRGIDQPELEEDIASLEEVIDPAQPLSVRQLYKVTKSKEDRAIVSGEVGTLSGNTGRTVPFDPALSLADGNIKSVFLQPDNPAFSLAQPQPQTKTETEIADNSSLPEQVVSSVPVVGQEQLVVEGQEATTLPVGEQAKVPLVAKQPVTAAAPKTQSVTAVQQPIVQQATVQKSQVIYRPKYYVVPVYVNQQDTIQTAAAPATTQHATPRGQAVAVPPPAPSYDHLPAYKRPVRRRSTGLFVTPKPTSAEKEMANRKVALTSEELKRVNDRLVVSTPAQAVSTQQIKQPAFKPTVSGNEPFTYKN